MPSGFSCRSSFRATTICRLCVLLVAACLLASCRGLDEGGSKGSRGLQAVTAETLDGDILCYFYNAATNKARLTNWCGAKSGGNYVNGPCTGASAWKAVACTNGRVASVDLPNAGVYGSNDLGGGSIPTQLGGLTGLTYINFGANSLSGSIPTQLGGLTGLTFLDLWGNSLSGSIPTQLGKLTGLTYLALNGNSFTGPIPASFCSLQPSIGLWLLSNPGFTCYPSCLASYSTFMNYKGSLSAECPSGTPACCAHSDVFFRC